MKNFRPFLALLILAACSTDSGEYQPSDARIIPDPTDIGGNLPPDRPKQQELKVDESRITLAFEGDKVVVSMVVERADDSTEPVGGTVTVGLAPIEDLLGGKVTLQVSAGFTLDGDEVAIVLEGSADALEIPKWTSYYNVSTVTLLGKYLMDWEVSWGPHSIAGRKSAWEALEPLDLSLWIPSAVSSGTINQARVSVQKLSSGTPVQGIQVALSDSPGHWEALSQGVTDQSGNWVGEFAVSQGAADAVTLMGSAIQGPFRVAAVAQVPVTPLEGKLLLTTDKPLYQPGQTVHLRVMALQSPGNLPLKNADAEFVVIDSQGNKLARLKTTTNDHGIASATYGLGSKLNLGSYDIVALVGGLETAKAIKVSRYNLPKFKVEVSFSQKFFTPGDTLEGVIHAYYLFGKSVAGGKVKIQSFLADGETPGPFSISGSTDEEGFLDFSFELPADASDLMEGDDGKILLAVDVTDAADHTITKDTSVVLTKAPLRVYVVPETTPLTPGLEHEFYLITTDPFGAPVASANQVTIGEDSFNADTAEAGVATFTASATGELEIQVLASGDEGKADELFTFPVGGEGSGIAVRTDRSVYQAGDMIQVTVLAGAGDGALFVDMMRGGQTLAMEAAELVEGMGELDLALPEGVDGELYLLATLLTDDGTTVTGKKLVYVERHRRLKVDFSTDKEQYRPGEQAKLTLEISDEAGVPAQAAIGLSVVDEALFAIQDAKPGLLWRFFEVGQTFVEPEWQHPFPAQNLTGKLSSSFPEESDDDFETMQQWMTATFAALKGLNLYTVRVAAEDLEAPAQGQAADAVNVQITYFENALEEKFDDGRLDEDALTAHVTSAVWIDPWGNLYEVEAHDGSGFDFRSRGMDEKWETFDDISGWMSWDDIVPCYDCYYYDYYWYDYYGMADSVSAAEEVWAVELPYDNTPQDPELPGGGKATKVRRWFPETLYVNPALITDEDGKASVDLLLADSITQWRATGMANSAGGRLGSDQYGITVFQEFFIEPDLPVTFTRNDKVTFPVAVFSYLNDEQVVTVQLEDAAWYEVVGSATQEVVMTPQGVDAVYFTLIVKEVGWHNLVFNGSGAGGEDTMARTIRVNSDGDHRQYNVAGATGEGGQGTLNLPGNTIAGSMAGTLKFYGTGMTHVLEGVDSLLHYPSG